MATVFALFDRLGIAFDTKVARAGLALVAVAATLSPTSWGSEIFQSEAVPATVAMAVAIWSFFFALRERWLLAFAAAGIAIVVQFLVGLYAGLAIVPALLLAGWRKRSPRLLALPLALWLTPAIAIFTWMLGARRDVPADFDFMEVFGRFRVPHHWFPSTGLPIQWIGDTILLVAAVIAIRALATLRPRRREPLFLLGGAIALAALGVFANILLVEIVPITFVGKLQLQRLIPFGHLAAYLALGAALATWHRHDERHQRQLRIALILAVAPLIFTAVALQLPGPVAVVALLLAVYGWISGVGRVAVPAAILGLAALLVLVHVRPPSVFAPGVRTLLAARYDPLGERAIPGERMIAWIRAETPKSAMLLHTPEWDDFTATLSMRARRASYVSFKNVPYTDHGVAEWQRRFERLADREIASGLHIDDARSLWRQRPSREVEQLGREVGACYLVDRIVDRADHFGEALVVDRRGDVEWGLWRIADCDDAAPIGRAR